MSRISIFKEERFVEEHALRRDVVRIGRHHENDIVLNDPTLSRFHARLEARDESYALVPVGARNGVFINGQEIDQASVLAPGDRVVLGRFVAIFDQESAARARRRRRDNEGEKNRQVGREFKERSSELPPFDDATDPDAALEKSTSIEGGIPTVVVLFNGKEVERFDVAARPLVIGRSKNCDITIGLLGLSRRHTQIERSPDGVFVEDLGSQNGTWVNNERIVGRVMLSHGDLLNFYDYGVLYAADHRTLKDIPMYNGLPDDGSFDARETAIGESPSSPGQKLPKHLLEKIDGAKAEEGFGEGALLSAAFDISTGDDQPIETSADATPISDEDPINDPTTSGRPQRGRGVTHRGAWPSPADIDLVLDTQAGNLDASLDVFLDGRLFTMTPIEKPITRIGKDSRCELALPKSGNMQPWHITLIQFGSVHVMYRASPSGVVRVGGRPTTMAVLRNGDEIAIGNILLRYHKR